MSEVDVSRCRSRIERFVKESHTEYGVAASASKFSTGINEVLPLLDWAGVKYEGDDKSKPDMMSSVKRVADALDISCDGCKKGCEVLNWLPLVDVDVESVTTAKPEYTDEPMPRAPVDDEVEETIELITA